MWIVLAAVIAFLVWFGWLSDRINIGAAPDSTTATPRARGLSTQQLSVAGVRPGSSENEVTQALGRPDVALPPHYDASLGDSVSNWTYDGILVEVAAHGVVKVHCSATRCATADGVAVGDSRSHLVSVYGPPRAVETISDLEVLRYAGRVAECSLNFTIKGDAVATIDLNCTGE